MSKLVDAATWYKGLPHQKEAWEALEDRLPKHLVSEFLGMYRSGPEARIFTPRVFEQLTGYSQMLFTEEECLDADRLMSETGFAEHPEAMCMLMANILHETGNMRWMKELASGQAYENRSDLGNTQPGDGPRFKGSGVLQLTGRYNYRRLANDLQDERIMEGCDYVARTYPFRSAKTWIEENKLLEVCLNSGFEACCKRINGGWNGIEDRYLKFSTAKRVLM